MRATTAMRMFRQTPRLMRPVPRLRKLKQIPAELFPLAAVVGFAVAAAGYSCARKFWVDKNLRLGRQGPSARADH
ncbi:hypothetical protein CRV24_006949 [Beauveria bassiana]|uniref:NADH-ubiquinone reductase complex 1 MLRQ subunit n=1 Tax=Beauveria bassiana TaxID=176275 RepID=A0A2N6NJH3_BEABA|nr:hypothetical protein CRV24_006949 [Beauveria bassiana]PMB67437.1 hypothetical protein BM221_007105 [Beauveria bassiana]